MMMVMFISTGLLWAMPVATLCIGAVITCMSISVQYVSSSLLLFRHVMLFMEVIFSESIQLWQWSFCLLLVVSCVFFVYVRYISQYMCVYNYNCCSWAARWSGFRCQVINLLESMPSGHQQQRQLMLAMSIALPYLLSKTFLDTISLWAADLCGLTVCIMSTEVSPFSCPLSVPL